MRQTVQPPQEAVPPPASPQQDDSLRRLPEDVRDQGRPAETPPSTHR